MIVFPEQRIDQLITDEMRAEGWDAYTNDPDDAGKETRWGITVDTARAYGYTGPMRDLPEATARAIYRKRYVDAPRFGDVFAIDPSVGAELIDTGINMGTAVAAMFLQRWLNGFNDTGSRYGDLYVDGQIGPVTLAALRAFIQWRGLKGINVLLCGLKGVKATRYLEITESKRSQRKFLYGWVLNRVVTSP
ncbi:glycosyl hydrolase 108 family protein [Dyella sp. ASV21]|uniref:glycoside hydrolase family 108 protein n=1 Tax=Dyella sp. ASV21 TaxID=2795114 RepID=UPI0018EAD59C|nr:glycosyl hydrolase 108 family protein [Dyella sp. ASV21]